MPGPPSKVEEAPIVGSKEAEQQLLEDVAYDQQ